MRLIAGVVVAGILAGAVRAGEPAAVNPYNGMQEREEKFEFAQKPSVAKQGDKWVVTFAAVSNCDATVAILGPDGKIVRHLASGVLGKNAPHPFQQSSSSQKIGWDGQDDQGKPAPAGCKVRVSLGLRPRFDMNIGYDHYDLPASQSYSKEPGFESGKYLVGKGPGGEIFVLGMPHGGMVGRVYRDGKYLRTFWPPAARDVEKLTQFKPLHPLGAYRFAKTTWGDSVLMCGSYGPTGFNGDARKLTWRDQGKAMFFAAGVENYGLENWPVEIKRPTLDWDPQWYYSSDQGVRMAADREREEVYFGWVNKLLRLDGRTGKLDTSFYPKGELGRTSECHVGPDGLLYLRVGTFGYGQYIVKLDHAGKPVDFGGDAVSLPKEGKWHDTGERIYGDYPRPQAFGKQEIKALWTGLRNHSNVHERGLFVSPRGFIVAGVQHHGTDPAWETKNGVPEKAPAEGSYVRVWANDGKLLTANAVGDMGNGHGIAMDRDGNIYAAMGARWPAGQTSYYGIVGEKGVSPNFGAGWGSYGSLLKFRGGLDFPLGFSFYGKNAPADAYGKDAPADAAKLVGYRMGPMAVQGALWIWGGLVCQTPDICSCHNIRYDMDYFARHWVPSNQLYSVTVLDANGNRIARLGRYGNVDDTDEDVKAGRDGLRFVWPRALCVSDTALYVTDIGSRRILKAVISYAAEETIPAP